MVRKNEREIQMDLGIQSRGGRSFNGLGRVFFRNSLSAQHRPQCPPLSRPPATSNLEIYSVSISFHTYIFIWIDM